VTARGSQGFPAGLSVHVFGLLAGCAVPAALGVRNAWASLISGTTTMPIDEALESLLRGS